MRTQVLIVMVILWSSLFIKGQAIYTGHIQDVASRKSLSDVSVHLLNSSIESNSNYFGDFLIKNSETDSIHYNQNSYRFYNNSVIWKGAVDIDIEIFSVDGKLITIESNIGSNGNYLIPTLPIGIYLLRIKSSDEITSFKLFSNGNRTIATGEKIVWHHSSVKAVEDTLVFTKEGYYSRFIPLLGSDTLLTVNLLKKENKELHYFNELIDPIAYDLVSGLRARRDEGKAETVKIIYNTEDELMYYINTVLYDYHHTFAKNFLGFDQGNNVFNQTQYREGESRYLYPANLNYYEGIDKYVLYIVSINEMTCENIKILYDKILETSYLEGKLYLFANRAEFEFCDVPKITPDELYEGENYQALNREENFGYLTKVEIDDLENTYLGRHDIVLLNGIPNDVSVVAGIITTEFQTPLSHINVLSNNRNTPNMALRDGWENERLDTLIGELVYLKVDFGDFEIRKATIEEATAFWSQNEPQEIVSLPKNTSIQGLVDLEEADYTFLDIIGGKATNFAEMLNVSYASSPIPTPESSFAIPFYYYDKHLKDNGLDSYLVEMLAEDKFNSDPAYRKAQLEGFQELIKDKPLDPELIELVEQEIKDFEDFSSFRFRSSTNAEDLESFSGAGLYSSHSAKKNNPDKTIEKAIKKVWASLWNWRAFEERSYYKIVHTSCAMGVLVHRSFPDEDANGVIITKNPYNSNDAYIINVQYKEYSIVFPEPGILNDQIMLLTWSNVSGQNFTIEYLTFSNVPELNGETVMTDEELYELGAYCKALKNHFYDNLPHSCNCIKKNFGLDIEFKIDSQVEDRKLYIKQARFYK